MEDKLAEKDFSSHLLGDIAPADLRVTGVHPPPELFAHFPSRDDVAHPLPALQVPEDSARDFPVRLLDRVGRSGEQRPEQRDHGTGEDDDAEAVLKRLLGRGLDFGGRSRVGEDVVVEVDERGLLVGVRVVQDRLEAGVIGGTLDGDHGGGDFGAPLM